MFTKPHTRSSLRFRRWSRRSYAAFQSVGKHVTIGNLKNIVADTFLGKQTNTVSLADDATLYQKDIKEAFDPLSERAETLLPEFLILRKPIRYKNEWATPFLLNRFYLWPTAFFAVGHFLFITKQKVTNEKRLYFNNRIYTVINNIEQHGAFSTNHS